MKKLFGDGIISKLRPIPSFAWIIFVVASFFFAEAYEILLTGEYYATALAEAYAETGITLNIKTVGILTAIGEALIYTLIFEAIIAVVYNMVAGRFRAHINKADYKFRLRYFIVLVNLVIGILSIGYFFTQTIDSVPNPSITFFDGKCNLTLAENPYYTIQSSILPFLITSVAALLFYEDFRLRFVPQRNQAALFSRFALLYVGISALLFTVNIFQNFLLIKDNAPTDVYKTVAYSLTATAYVAIGVIYYLYYRKLKKEKDTVVIETFDSDSSKKEKIFDDFGF